MRHAHSITCAALVPFLLTMAHAQVLPETPSPTGEPENIQQRQPGFLVRVDVDRSTRSYGEGDPLAVRVNCEEDAYIYVLYKQADGRVYQIFPNSGQRNNLLKARQALQVPATDDRFRWQIGPPYGKEVVKVIASKQPIEKLSEAQMRTKQFNPISREQMKGIEVEIGEEAPAAWAEDQVEISTYERGQQQIDSAARRYGVFLGVSEYLFNQQVRVATEGKNEMNLPCCHRDARQLAQIMHEVGRLDDVRVYTNEQSTRARFEQAVTGWLASVSRPGDTVVIYFSGHGGQLNDDNGDEGDGKDEILLPHDYLSSGAILGLMEQEKQGKLDPRFAPVLAAARRVIAQAPTVEKGIEILERGTGVSDDLFGHWLQRLAGRQVIVIFDICHAGGFANQEKSLLSSAAAFDFMDKELDRLKDLGQPDTALFAACRAQEVSRIHKSRELSVMTHYLLDSIQRASAALALKDASPQITAGMRDYYEQLNADRRSRGEQQLTPHEPVLYDYCIRPALLKP